MYSGHTNREMLETYWKIRTLGGEDKSNIFKEGVDGIEIQCLGEITALWNNSGIVKRERLVKFTSGHLSGEKLILLRELSCPSLSASATSERISDVRSSARFSSLVVFLVLLLWDYYLSRVILFHLLCLSLLVILAVNRNLQLPYLFLEVLFIVQISPLLHFSRNQKSGRGFSWWPAK